MAVIMNQILMRLVPRPIYGLVVDEDANQIVDSDGNETISGYK